MDKKTITINGKNFFDLESFYDEMDNLLTNDLSWQTGHNLNAFIDLLRGGFGVYEYEEPVIIVWNHFSLSTNALGQDLINDITGIIAEHGHIEFSTTG